VIDRINKFFFSHKFQSIGDESRRCRSSYPRRAEYFREMHENNKQNLACRWITLIKVVDEKEKLG